jgi:SAM-dependent methyltransferase
MATDHDRATRINAREWFHSIEIDKGLVTPGRVPLSYLLDMLKSLGFPESLKDLSVLDIGAWDGFFSFEAEKRGAKRVVAYDLHPPDYYGFALAKELLGSEVEYIQGSVYDLSPAVYGTFDVVFFFGVLYHLRYPLLALDRIWEVTNQYLLLETHCLDNRLVLSDGSTVSLSEIDQRLTNISLFQFYRGDELHTGDFSNWFAPNRCSVEETLWSAGFHPEFLATWNDRVAYKAVKLPGTPEYQKQTYRGLAWMQSPDGNRSWAFPLRRVEGQAAGQTREFPATVEQGGYQHQETPKLKDLQAQAVSLGRQLEVAKAEGQWLSEENNHLRQQLAATEEASSELLASVQTLTAQYRGSEALRLDQMALVKTQEQQLSALRAQLELAKQVLDIVRDTRMYRLLRQLGRWKFMEQMLPPLPADAAPQSQCGEEALTVPSRAEREQQTPSGAEPSSISPPPQEADIHRQAEFETCYAQVRPPKKRGGVSYSQGAEGRIVQRLRGLGLEVYDYEIDAADYRQYFRAARYVEDFPDYYPDNLPEKSLEHYVAAKLLRLNEQDTYIDIASEHSPVHEIYRRLFGAKTYQQDLAYPPGLNGAMLGGDAANMPVPDGFASKMALHCSFEHFEGETDSRFISETARVLRPGGAVCIVPLYLFEEYAIQTDPVLALSAGIAFEDEAAIYCAQGWNNRHGRFYDAEHLLTRVCKHLNGLTLEIYTLVNVQQVDASCYARFAMLIKKPEVR